MKAWEFQTMLTMMAVAAMCALPGTLLVLRRMVMIGDAISHVLLCGIVLAYFIVRDFSSPWLMIGAALSGVATVAIVELLQKTHRVKEDAAIGLVFPALFSVGTILASLYLKNTHLDVDRVLLGNAINVTLDKVDIGIRVPRALVTASILLTVNACLIVMLSKEVKLSIFDAGLAATLGFAPAALHYGIMTSVSLTTVVAFDAVGPVLVLAFFAIPTATARLLTDRFAVLFALSLVIGMAAAVVGSVISFRFNTTIAATAAAVLGLAFVAVFFFAPRNGVIAQARRRIVQRRSFHETMLLIHLLTHEGTSAEIDEASEASLPMHLAWTETDVTALARRSEAEGFIRSESSVWKLTETGRARAQEALHRPVFTN